jgi:hypothetical protein
VFPLHELLESGNFELKGASSCGGTAFEIEGEIPEKLARCRCSFCAKRGWHCAYTPQQFKLTTSASHVAAYCWNSKLVAHHYFCPKRRTP